MGMKVIVSTEIEQICPEFVGAATSFTDKFAEKEPLELVDNSK